MAFSQRIFAKLKQSDWVEKAQNIHIFISVEKLGEVPTQDFIQFLWAKGKSVFIPKVEGKSLITCEYTPETLMEISHWGILEPQWPKIVSEKEIDLVISPLLICDKKGTRVGYGGGFYDKLFTKCKPNVLKIGVNYFPPIENTIPTLQSDVPLDYLVTPENIFCFDFS